MRQREGACVGMKAHGGHCGDGRRPAVVTRHVANDTRVAFPIPPGGQRTIERDSTAKLDRSSLHHGDRAGGAQGRGSFEFDHAGEHLRAARVAVAPCQDHFGAGRTIDEQ